MCLQQVSWAFSRSAFSNTRSINLFGIRAVLTGVNYVRTSLSKITDDASRNGKQLVPLEKPEHLHRERYIPITRRTIIRYIMEEEKFLMEFEKKQFDNLAIALDSVIVNKYHYILQELKVLFDPINPDKDTVTTRQFTRRENLDNEFWLLQHLEDIMEKAGFYELERSRVQRLLADHESSEGVRVTVDSDRYDVLRYWVLGLEQPDPQLTWWQRLLVYLKAMRTTPSVEYYKRVVVAIRLKKDRKLLLKAFKEVPINNLEMLLPDGTLHMTKVDKGILSASVFLALTGVLVKIVTVMAGYNIDLALLVTLVTGGVAGRSWTVYKNKRQSYVLGISRLLYFKNLANNRGLLALLVDRAEDETFKEALLTYTFLLTNRSPSAVVNDATLQNPDELGSLTEAALEKKIGQWIFDKTGVNLKFNSSEAVRLLKSLGTLKEENEKLYVLPLMSAIRCLPVTPQSLVARSAEADIAEGYDRDEYLETERMYKEEDERSRRYGWF